MELELKHIVGYLPYNLQIQDTLHNFSFDLTQKYNQQIPDEFKKTYGEIVLEQVLKDEVLKPILYPLSMLTNPINHNGDKFVPIVRLLGHEFLIKHNHSFGYDRKKYYSKFMIENTNEWIYSNIPSDLQSMDYLTVSKLQEWHFDIHGLIERGLAIDKNSL